jgi:hypothetical protein
MVFAEKLANGLHSGSFADEITIFDKEEEDIKDDTIYSVQ